jgi:uncharacterized protein DUF4236
MMIRSVAHASDGDGFPRGLKTTVGFYLRKSLRLGPLRFNLSKGGVGVSAGVKGARVGVDASGREYVAGGRGGVYFRDRGQRVGGAFLVAVIAAAIVVLLLVVAGCGSVSRVPNRRRIVAPTPTPAPVGPASPDVPQPSLDRGGAAPPSVSPRGNGTR